MSEGPGTSAAVMRSDADLRILYYLTFGFGILAATLTLPVPMLVRHDRLRRSRRGPYDLRPGIRHR
jgi:hypothetical protein